MLSLRADDPAAVAVVDAIRSGDRDALGRLLRDDPQLVTARIVAACGDTRTLLHVVTDWPGHFPNGAATVAVLADAGAEVNARFGGSHRETPLHWAASSDDVAVLVWEEATVWPTSRRSGLPGHASSSTSRALTRHRMVAATTISRCTGCGPRVSRGGRGGLARAGAVE